MVYSGIYIVNLTDDGTKCAKYSHTDTAEEKTYNYQDAIDLTGNGSYNRGLLAVLSLGLLGMGIEVFGFSVIVTGSNCDFQLEHWQRSALLSMPFVGPILLSIAWGYISDTQGRRKSLLIALWGSFLFSFISAFSPNWIVLGVLKVLSSSLAVQSITYALLNESCASNVKGTYMLIMTSVMLLFILSYDVPAYYILQLDFIYNLGLISFTPWRLLTILLAVPLGLSAFLLHFFYESPKFLVNVGQEAQALEFLAKIVARNGGKIEEYPVRKIVLNEDKSPNGQDVHIIRSLWLQMMPLFKPPLLWTTLLLFHLTAVVYCVNNSLVIWMPYIIESFTIGTNSATGDGSRSLCSIITSTVNTTETGADDTAACSSSIQSHTVLSGIAHGLVIAGTNLAVSKLASRKKILMIVFLFMPGLASLGAIYNQNSMASLILFVCMTITNLCMGVLFSYYVELFPTSYSGMASSLGVLVARISGLAGVNVLGIFMNTHCTIMFYFFAAYLLSGVLVAMFLPPDIKDKKVSDLSL